MAGHETSCFFEWPLSWCQGRRKFGNQPHFDLFLGVCQALIKCIHMVELVGVSGKFLFLGLHFWVPQCSHSKQLPVAQTYTGCPMCLCTTFVSLLENLIHSLTHSFIHSSMKYKWRYDAEIPGLSRDLKESKAAIWTLMLTAASCTTAKRWKPPKCPLMDGRANKQDVGYTCNGI